MNDWPDQAAPGILRRDARPPIEMDSAPPPGAAALPYVPLRRTAQMRPAVTPARWDDAVATLGYPVDDRYVRRYWTAVIGPGAVADLLRLATAARRGRSLPRPIYLHVLAREGLVRVEAGRIMVRPTVPPLSEAHVRRLPPGLRREHTLYRMHEAHRPSSAA